MSTVFAVEVDGEDEPIEVAFRSNGIRFTNPIAKLLPDNTPVIPLNNSAQGIYTIGDIRKDATMTTNQAPSATVDENMPLWKKYSSHTASSSMRTITFDSFQQMMSELHSQQPTVTMEKLWLKYMTKDKSNGSEFMWENNFEKAITEATQGLFTREDMIKAFTAGCEFITDNKPNCSKWLTQYDAERGKSNGKV